jgi:ABC-type bacteriocin/lantibiotic exporter with double-glycine peptidase domain
MKEWIKQGNWNENIAAIIATFCEVYELEISQTTLFEKYSGKDKMVHFNTIKQFCDDWEIDSIQIKLVEQHLDSDFAPAFVLMDGYRTQLFVGVKNNLVEYIDSLTGWHTESKSDFLKRSKGIIVLLDYSNYKKEAAYAQIVLREKKLKQLSERKWIAPQVKKINPVDQVDVIK